MTLLCLLDRIVYSDPSEVSKYLFAILVEGYIPNCRI